VTAIPRTRARDEFSRSGAHLDLDLLAAQRPFEPARVALLALDVVLEHRVERWRDLHLELVETLLEAHLRQREQRAPLRERHVLHGADEVFVAIDTHGGRGRDAGVERDLQLERRLDLGPGSSSASPSPYSPKAR
jgi:hypothetical protein